MIERVRARLSERTRRRRTAQAGALVAVVAVLGLASTLPDGGSPASDVRTTPAATGQSAAEQPSGGEAAAPADGRTTRPAAGTGGEKPAAVQGAQKPAKDAVREAPTLETTRTPITTTTTSPPTAPAGDREIAFVRGSAIWLMHADGSGLGPLTDGSTRLSDPDWAPDGQRLVAVAGRTDATGDHISWFVTVGLDGTVTRLTGDGHDRAPKWSPDGSRIAFARRTSTHLEQSRFDLWVMHADGSGARKLAATDAEWRFSWAPDGSRLVYSCGPRLCTIRPDGSDVRTLPEAATVAGPTWSPDGERLAGTVQTGTGWAVVSVRLDGTDRRVLADDFAHELDWSADGRHVVFSTMHDQRSTSIWRVGADGSAPRALTAAAADTGDFMPTWRPS